MRHFVRYYAWIWGVAGLALVATVGLLGLRADHAKALGLPFTTKNRPFHFFLDMKYQPRYGAQGQSQFFADGRAMRTPVEGTVAFGGADYARDAGQLARDESFLAEDDTVYRGMAGDKFVEAIPEKVVGHFGGWGPMLRRGREAYAVHCTVCHGQAGDGMGIVGKYNELNSYGLKPASYHDDRLRQLTLQNKPGGPLEPNPDGTDGHLFNVITNGKNTMMAYGHQVKVMDRWAIVSYLRALQRAQVAGIEDVQGPDRLELERK